MPPHHLSKKNVHILGRTISKQICNRSIFHLMTHKTKSAPKSLQQLSLKRSSGTAEEKKTRSAELLLRFRTICALVRTQLSTNYPIRLKCHFARLKTEFAQQGGSNPCCNAALLLKMERRQVQESPRYDTTLHVL